MLSYCAARFERTQKEEAYRIYVTESLWGLAHGRALEAHYKDFFDKPPEESRTAEEIISHIEAKLAAL